MKQKLLIFTFLILIGVLLVGLNAASYTQKEKVPDSEFNPNRSTFNSGATGTQAFYTLLSETGRKTVRWQEPPAALLTVKNGPAVFVVTGTVKREFTEPEIEELLRWVSNGGRLVLIDRSPVTELLTTTANWQVSIKGNETPELFTVDASDTKQMTAETTAMKPAQPTIYTQGVNAVQPSRFAGSIMFERFIDNGTSKKVEDLPPPPKAIKRVDPPDEIRFDAPPPKRSDRIYEMPSPTPVQLTPIGDTVESPSQMAPVVHFSGADKNLVVNMPFGEGEIVLLSDPYIVSNSGISLVDNAQLAINIVAAGDRVIAFDEYHQGYGKDTNRFLQFFAGTPVVAIFLQLALFIGLVFFSQSRRFARPVPEPEPDRLSKLEYVSAMAELQQRTRAFDLAIENIYNEFRRRVTRLLGLDNFKTKSNEIARAISERAGLDASSTAATLHECEEIIRGASTNKKQVLRLVGELRAVEQKLGLVRAGRTKI
ncbi:MAG: DUF4350 domain-containing protein [Pyrinomonadaceae bacterium]